MNEEGACHRRPFKYSFPFTAQSLMKVKMTKPNGEEGYKFIKEEEKAQNEQPPPPLEQENEA